jgi:tetraacyldisaccharide 4'-kinase
MWIVRPHSKPIAPPVPTLSVGNLRIGGTGKTPVVQALARYCLAQGIRPAILLRGYRRRSRGMVLVSAGEGPCVPWQDAGDEAWLHAWKLPQALVLVDRRRERAALTAVAHGAELLLLDDGFQYRRLGRDADLVVIDPATLRARCCIPFGTLRQPLRAARRATLLLLWEELAGNPLPAELAGLPTVLLRFRSGMPYRLDSTGATHPLQQPPDCPVVAFAGIARPERFRSTLLQHGWHLAAWYGLPDHYRYGRATLWWLLQSCRRHRTPWLATTEKDAVRLLPLLPRLERAGCTLAVFPLEAEFCGNSAPLWELLQRLVEQARRARKDLA